MSEYEILKKGKLVLKGEKTRKRKHKKTKKEAEPTEEVKDEDSVKHGGWWMVKRLQDITGAVCIEFGQHTYVRALDNGLFTLGAPHDEGEGPAPEEILTAFVINEDKVALKSGYGKYLRVEKDGSVTGRSDAVGPMDQWEPVFQDDKLALLGHLGCFMGVDPVEDTVVARSKRAGPAEFIQVRTALCAERDPESEATTEEKGSLAQVEENFVRKFQKFQDKKLRICTEDRKELRKAKEDGIFHEAMLDRRSKMKADRYCK